MTVTHHQLSQDLSEGSDRPLTGVEYIESLRDGRFDQ